MNGAARIPREQFDSSHETQRQGHQEPVWNHRVLIVEDENSIAEAYRDILSSQPNNVLPLRRSSRSPAPQNSASNGNQSTGIHHGSQVPGSSLQFELTVVSSAEKAIAEVKHAVATNRPFTMGFFDVLLGGGMDGIELVKSIFEIDPRMHAVFVTAYSDRGVDSIQTFLGEGFASRWDYLNKPFTKGEILQKARNSVTLWNLQREKEFKEERLATLERQLREKEILSTVAIVARGIGHEFRNILTLIMGNAELGLVQNTENAMKSSLDAVMKASRRAEEILNRFKFLANPEDRKVEKKSIFVHQPIEEALMLIDHQLKENKIRVCWIRKKQIQVAANATSLLQVFVNLFINAMHAMGNSGQIDISISEVGEKVEVRIRDYGPGVSREVLSRMTEPFFTTKGENGSGLGLAIVRDIVEGEHDGTLKIANHEAKGLEVTMTFPAMASTSKGESA